MFNIVRSLSSSSSNHTSFDINSVSSNSINNYIDIIKDIKKGNIAQLNTMYVTNVYGDKIS
jgi:hypothetical protein